MELTHEALQSEADEHLLLNSARNGAYDPGANELLGLDRGEGPYVFDTVLDEIVARMAEVLSGGGEFMAMGAGSTAGSASAR